MEKVVDQAKDSSADATKGCETKLYDGIKTLPPKDVKVHEKRLFRTHKIFSSDDIKIVDH